MKHFIPILLAASLSLGGIASAETVKVDFDGGKAVDIGTASVTFGGPGFSYGSIATVGVWQENSVNTYWQMYSDLLGNYGYEKSEITPNLYRNLSNEDPGADPFVTERMVVSRADGGLFDLKRIGAGPSYEGLAVIADFLPAPGVDIQPAFASVPLLGPSLSITGVKADGTIVTGTGTTKTVANLAADLNGFSLDFVFNPIDVIFSSEVLAAFTGLKSMTLQVFQGADLVTERATALKSLLDFGAPPILLEGALRCGLRYSCSVPGLGDFSVGVDRIGGRNDLRNVFISDFDLEFHESPMSEPAPVPLPASALLLLGALGATALLRARRRA